MKFEVEQKFRVPGFSDVERVLRELSARFQPPFEQVDCYYAHPSRDFRMTDEAFRVRSSGDTNCVTYKGPRVDSATKTRRELELALPDGAEYRQQFGLLLEQLGFRSVAEVHKVRSKAFVDWEGSQIEVSLDEVEKVGTFVELELTATDAELDQMRQRIQSLASRLELTHNERRSYLGLLLESLGQQ